MQIWCIYNLSRLMSPVNVAWKFGEEDCRLGCHHRSKLRGGSRLAGGLHFGAGGFKVRRLTWNLGCVLTSFPLSSPIVGRQERVPEHLFWMRVENFFGVVCACADSDLFTSLRRMPLILPRFHWSTVCSLRFD
ncbi:hypothetical protein AVEN_166772-1 [Araneus ventricosus]|uniref:Uncharacterized protein n=1 Tax=Araneus ventricosus TaxID=182803 RepID=A0A4Y2BNE7_ARAVE|nr:hypothetical protein AVEN_166772-1 [Araneus ventricosus]